jgi:hypothetical protein
MLVKAIASKPIVIALETPVTDQPVSHVMGRRKRSIVADANKQRSIPGSEWIKERDPETASRAVKEYIATLDDAAFGGASKVTPKFVSPSDPAAQWTGAMRGPAFFAYSDNYLIDVKVGIIMDVEASRSIRQAEVGASKTMIERTQERFDIKPERLAGDTAYGSGANLGRLRLRGPCGAQFEFTLAAIAQNLRRLAKLIAARPPPIALCAP